MALAALSARFRRARMQRFAAELGITAETRILDIGGTPECWRLLPVVPRVTLLNTPRAKADLGGAESWVAGDGRALPFRDGAFDVVFSNSVIEHVGDLPSQRRFAAEVARVGRAYWVETPNRWFPVEQHLLTPLLHWLPPGWQRTLMPRLNLWRLLVRVSADRRQYYIEHYLAEIRLLSGSGLKQLFPGAAISRERFLGWTKSLVAFKKER
ncbi:MAG TPA: methyltransferase domain-containing protein [Bryobacteraceae bacterium]|nr:methyltransferase domain-containing protein [Bryobacteraceae bacterium]